MYQFAFSKTGSVGHGWGTRASGQFIQLLDLDGTETKGQVGSAVLQMTTETLVGNPGSVSILSPYLGAI